MDIIEFAQKVDELAKKDPKLIACAGAGPKSKFKNGF